MRSRTQPQRRGGRDQHSASSGFVEQVLYYITWDDTDLAFGRDRARGGCSDAGGLQRNERTVSSVRIRRRNLPVARRFSDGLREQLGAGARRASRGDARPEAI